MSTIAEEIVKLRNNLSSAYDACEMKSATMPDERTMYNLSATIASIVQGEIPEGVEVPGAVWNDEWAAKAEASGTVIDVVVGDEKSYRREVGLQCGAIGGAGTIDWGDGSVSSVGSSSMVYAHTYETSGHYVIKLDNTISSLTMGNDFTTSTPTSATIAMQNNKTAVRRVRQFGSNIKSLTNAFWRCYFLNSSLGGYPGDLPPLPPSLSGAQGAFGYCWYYDGPLPHLAELTALTNGYQMFYYCRCATGTAQILPPNLVNAASMYCACSNLSTIPYDVFPDSLSATLTGTASTFDSTGLRAGVGDDQQVKFPRISHLVKDQSTASMFNYCRLCKGPLPALPNSLQLKNAGSMFSYCETAISVSEDYFSGSNLQANLASISYMFRECHNLIGQLPAWPAGVSGSGAVGAYVNCFLLGGTYKAFPVNATSLYCTHQGNYHLSGEIPALPPNITTMQLAFYNNYHATKFPALGNLVKITGTGMNQAFYGCFAVEDPPESWISEARQPYTTDLQYVFAFCYSLKSFPYELSGHTGVATTCANMFRECISLKTGPKSLPTKCTSTSYMFDFCYTLADPILPIGQLTTLTNVSYMYRYCLNLYPCVDSDGEITTDHNQLYRAFTTYTQAFSGASPDALRYCYDACVAAGASGTKLGGLAVNYNLCYFWKGGME